MPMEYTDYTHTVGAVPRHYVLRNQQRPTGLRRLVSLYGHVDMNGQLLYPATKTIVRLEWVQECFRAGALLPTDQWEIRGGDGPRTAVGVVSRRSDSSRPAQTPCPQDIDVDPRPAHQRPCRPAFRPSRPRVFDLRPSPGDPDRGRR
ncbi:hypothetical protein DB88DRAFT_538068 [Papiliotrema laurentii]|uniref:BRCT domain-containing protein n=1 Tax=Papiliotrema laurentii TaxID=5418 RepID=A0AAD9L8D0_PAPLA|nr:hypothetical protein DB88DRAFT_538068 [Papiliotrema laurentii]